VRDAGYEAWLAARDGTDPGVLIDGVDWYVIRHSGGTTGRPKGVGYTHHEWVLNCRNWAYSLERMRRDSVIGHAGPISHASGYLFLPAWLAGAANLLFGVFEPGKVLRMMGEHRVSHMFASPSLLASLARHPDAGAVEWPHLRSIFVGGGPITDATALLAHEVSGMLFQGDGQTEAVPRSLMGPEEWLATTVGSPAPDARPLWHVDVPGTFDSRRHPAWTERLSTDAQGCTRRERNALTPRRRSLARSRGATVAGR
jgi:acyl-coenzyme A synthetase/AMP-(fatty) acid ligase